MVLKGMMIAGLLMGPLVRADDVADFVPEPIKVETQVISPAQVEQAVEKFYNDLIARQKKYSSMEEMIRDSFHSEKHQTLLLEKFKGMKFEPLPWNADAQGVHLVFQGKRIDYQITSLADGNFTLNEHEVVLSRYADPIAKIDYVRRILAQNQRPEKSSSILYFLIPRTFAADDRFDNNSIMNNKWVDDATAEANSTKRVAEYLGLNIVALDAGKQEANCANFKEGPKTGFFTSILPSNLFAYGNRKQEEAAPPKGPTKVEVSVVKAWCQRKKKVESAFHLACSGGKISEVSYADNPAADGAAVGILSADKTKSLEKEISKKFSSEFFESLTECCQATGCPAVANALAPLSSDKDPGNPDYIPAQLKQWQQWKSKKSGGGTQ